MLGTNIVLKRVDNNPRRIQVHSIFPTIQCEGPYVGRSAIFIRLGGCNLQCKFCDTEFDDFHDKTIDEIISIIMSIKVNINLVVITGGEPLRQNICVLCDELNKHNFKLKYIS